MSRVLTAAAAVVVGVALLGALAAAAYLVSFMQVLVLMFSAMAGGA